ncbi:hypothetical protein LCGC14_1054790 [marine sediment metagenome]|uniref:Uncharacterized protein n=1 Tax=marine sediment metagenome TaxID=412755 RepID=A0A0F9QTU8_9ZZZZ
MSQQYSITLKQRVDGQIQVTSVRVPKEVLLEEPFIKEEIKREMEKKLEDNHVKVLKDVGIVEYD